jgi:hypothetical protein
MISNAPTLSGNGTTKDVAAFLGVSERQVKRFIAERPPRIAFARIGRRVVFPEDGVVRFKAKVFIADRRLSPGVALDEATREWREQLFQKAESRKQKAEMGKGSCGRWSRASHEGSI